MTKSLLIATVTALAITVPAQAEAAEQRPRAEERAQKAKERTQARKADRAKQRASRAAARPQAAERRQQRVSRATARPRAAERRQQRVQAERPKARERVSVRQQRQRVRAEQPRQRVQAERRAKRAETRARPQQRVVERRAPAVNRARPQRVERQARPQRVVRSQARPAERRSTIIESRNAGRAATQQLRQQQRQADRLARSENRAERQASRAERRVMRPVREALLQRPSRSVGDRLDLRQRQVSRDRNDGFATQRFSRRYDASPQHFYYRDHDDGYLYKVRRDTNVVTAQFPLLGGAFRVGQPLPTGYRSYNVPYAYRSLYYDTPNYRYRYGDGAIYRVDSSTLLIQAVVALLSGQAFGVGQMLPLGYDVYNVPYAYRDRYYDTGDRWYRYNDGYIYGVDPYSRRIESMYPVAYGGYSVGYPAPSYASYGGYAGYGGYGAHPAYSVPYGYNSLYYSQPGYNYHYANGGIYQVDPVTRIVAALVALVSGANLGVGQMLPAGYDVYNVPYAYRGTYFDTQDSWYRYDDGYIYQVDPRSRMIETAIPVSYGGYTIGQPVPSSYPGFPVPDHYGSLYHAQPGYDYRYFDGGIYQIDPTTGVVQALVALLTGQRMGVGQMLPAGYDAYNVPYAYRDRYYDTDRFLYRYSDGYIYQVDPQTRLVRKVINAVA